MNVNQIKAAIISGDFTNDELNEIARSIQFARSDLAAKAKRQLTVGDTVEFTSSKTRGVIQGTVEKINKKYVIVHESSTNGANLMFGGNKWRVPAEMLSKV